MHRRWGLKFQVCFVSKQELKSVNVNMLWMCNESCITKWIISGICCYLGGFCVWFGDLWACWFHYKSSHAQKELMQARVVWLFSWTGWVICLGLSDDLPVDIYVNPIGPREQSVWQVREQYITSGNTVMKHSSYTCICVCMCVCVLKYMLQEDCRYPQKHILSWYSLRRIFATFMLYLTMQLFWVLKNRHGKRVPETPKIEYLEVILGKLRNIVWVTSVLGLCWKFRCWMGHGWKRGWRD
jgi:hypothetical protein